MSVGTLRLHSFFLSMLFSGVDVVVRERRHLEASLIFSFGGLLWCAYVVGRERRYLGA